MYQLHWKIGLNLRIPLNIPLKLTNFIICSKEFRFINKLYHLFIRQD